MFNSFRNRVEFGTILEGLRNFGGGLNPSRYATGWDAEHASNVSLYSPQYSECLPLCYNCLESDVYTAGVPEDTYDMKINVPC